MKKCIFTILFVMALINGISAQEQAFGLQLGYAQPTLREPKTLPSTTDVSNKTMYKGFKFGVAYEGTIIKGFGTYLALDYNFGADISKWAPIYSLQSRPQKRDAKFFHSISLRTDWQYKFAIAKETYLLLYTGPTIGINAGMKNIKEEEVFNAQTTQFDIKTTTINRLNNIENNTDPLYNTQLLRYNIQWGIGAGFQYQRYFVRGGYDFGLTNGYKHMYKDSNTSVPQKNYCRMDGWFVALGIYLWQSDK